MSMIDLEDVTSDTTHDVYDDKMSLTSQRITGGYQRITGHVVNLFGYVIVTCSQHPQMPILEMYFIWEKECHHRSICALIKMEDIRHHCSEFVLDVLELSLEPKSSKLNHI